MKCTSCTVQLAKQDACMTLRRSEVQDMLDHDHFLLGSHLVGDAAYPIGPQLMTPYRDNGHLSEKQKRFNTCLSRARVTIERAFGLLKTRFRRLFYMETKRPDIIVTLIITACVLHNACLMWGDTFEVPKATHKQDEESTTEYMSAEARRPGMEKREHITNSL